MRLNPPNTYSKFVETLFIYYISTIIKVTTATIEISNLSHYNSLTELHIVYPILPKDENLQWMRPTRNDIPSRNVDTDSMGGPQI